MTLAEFSVLVNASPKWVLNARALLAERVPYAVAAAERLAIIRTLNADFGMPLGRARSLADRVLDTDVMARIPSADGMAILEIDVARIRGAIAARKSRLVTMHESRRPGRRPRRVSGPIRAAEQYGIDIGLLKANLARSPEARLRQLDAMAGFRSRVRRRTQR